MHWLIRSINNTHSHFRFFSIHDSFRSIFHPINSLWIFHWILQTFFYRKQLKWGYWRSFRYFSSIEWEIIFIRNLFMIYVRVCYGSFMLSKLYDMSKKIQVHCLTLNDLKMLEKWNIEASKMKSRCPRNSYRERSSDGLPLKSDKSISRGFNWSKRSRRMSFRAQEVVALNQRLAKEIASGNWAITLGRRTHKYFSARSSLII